MEIDVVKLLVETTVGVLLMTLFSYAVSAFITECFKEPELLNDVLRARKPVLFGTDVPVVGWIAHFATGIAFALACEAYWQLSKTDADWFSTAWLGLASGLFGVLCWKIAFALAKKKPKIDFKGFYLQLVLAHLLFAVGVAGVHALWQSY